MKKITVCLFLLLAHPLLSQQPPIKQAAFQVVPLGVMGGIDESNLSAYLVAPAGSDQYIGLDAGTVYAGIEKAIRNKVFKGAASDIIKKQISGYFISHAHLDHVAGLIMTSPNDSTKTIYALPSSMKLMQDHYFNGDTWANFGDAGKGYLIKQYHYQTLAPGEEIAVTQTALKVTPYVLSHVHPFESTAFLVNNQGSYLLYLGDTGPDEVEQSNRLKQLWERVAPLIRAGTLRGIFIEVSYPNNQPHKKLFGHLTPAWLMKEMNVLAGLTGSKALKGLNVVINHGKPPMHKIAELQRELKANNPLGLNLIFPEQGKQIKL